LLAALANVISSALGTPLDWPDAKKVAGQVRSWGIEVGLVERPEENV
jgi:glutamate--cysteine ligase catalytic subunit